MGRVNPRWSRLSLAHTKPDSGKYIFDDQEVSVNSPRDASDLGIQTVYQDLALCDNLDVVANLYLGREETQPVIPGSFNSINEIIMEQRALHFIKDLHVNIPSIRSRIATLSGGQRQSVAVARAVMWNSKVVTSG